MGSLPPAPPAASASRAGVGGAAPSLGGQFGGTQRLRRLLGPGSESRGRARPRRARAGHPRAREGGCRAVGKSRSRVRGAGLDAAGEAACGLPGRPPGPGCFGVRAPEPEGRELSPGDPPGRCPGRSEAVSSRSLQTHSASCLCCPVVSAAAALTCSCGERPPGGEGAGGLGVALSGPRRRRDPLCPAPEGGCPGHPFRALPQVPAGEGGCASASCLWCWRIQTAVPAVSERRLLGRRETKPGLSSGLRSRA